ncbi:hypothetical protein [Patulibacter minatonensis]|uniref:hypothetical protein n=1 Tax=Patulibacter minatonensis TaxID=298163 RepID=UPI00047E4ECC|nr:hypothetical protein [Patulibacter minatonensis]
MIRRPLAIGPALGVAVLLVLPAGAGAVTGTVDGECASNLPSSTRDEPIVTTLAGGAPGSSYTVLAALPGKKAGSAGSVAGVFDAAGGATASITSLFGLGSRPSAGRTLELAVREASGVVTPIAETLVTNYTIAVAGRPTSPTEKRLVTVSGTPLAGQRLYGFVVRKGGSRSLRRVSLGVADACGHARARVALAPSRSARGTYRLYVGPGKTLRRTAATTLVQGFTITGR